MQSYLIDQNQNRSIEKMCIRDRDKQYGYMVGMVNGKVKKIPLGECAGKLKTVDPNAQEVLQAKRMGISFGD